MIISDVPLGGGLSSSAALEVATATLLEAATGAALDPREKARLCRQAEHEFAGVPCGLMDQLASVLGDEAGALLIDCHFEVVRVVPFADPDVSVLICNSNVQARAGRRRLRAAARRVRGGGAPARRRRACATPRPPWSRRRARELRSGGPPARPPRHHRERCARWRRPPTWRRASSPRSARSCTRATGRLRDDFEVSSAELDTLVDVAREIGEAGGVLGARMTGGGFGGCTVTLVRTEHVGTVAETLSREYRSRTGRSATSFISRPARGAHMLDPLTVI